MNAITIQNWMGATEVRNVLDRLVDFQRAFEQVFLSIAERLPRLEDEISRHVAATQIFREPLREKRSHLEALIDSMDHNFSDAINRTQDFSKEVDAIEASIGERLAEFKANFGMTDRLIENIARMGMNASFMASNGNSEGAAFVALTGELIDLAAEARRHARIIREDAVSAVSETRELVQLQVRLTGDIEQLVSDVQTEREAAVKVSVDGIDRLAAELELIKRYGDEIRQCIGKVMNYLQEQDILRQGFNHVVMIIKELEAEHAHAVAFPDAKKIAAYLAFQKKVSALAVRLLEQLQEQLAKLLRLITEPLTRIEQVAHKLIERSREYENPLPVVIDEAVAKLEESNGIRAAGDCESSLSGIERRIGNLIKQIKKLELLPVQLKMIAWNMKIEAARIPSLQSALNVAESLEETRRGLVGLYQKIEAAINLFGGNIGEIHESFGGVKHLGCALDSAKGMLCQRSREIGEFLSDWNDKTKALAEMRGGLIEESRRFRVDLEKLHAEVENNGILLTDCGRLRDAAEEYEREFPQISDTDDSECMRLQMLVDRFTIFDHKEIAAEIADVSLDSHDEGGQITIF